MQAAHLLLQLQSRVYSHHYQGLAKYDQEVYDFVMELFDNLPLSAIVNNKFLCIHGGISTDFQTVTPASFRSLIFRR